MSARKLLWTIRKTRAAVGTRRRTAMAQIFACLLVWVLGACAGAPSSADPGPVSRGNASQAPARDTAGRTITLSYFGMHMHRAGTAKTPWPSVPFGSWRLWDSQTGWANLEPARGQWKFDTLDRLVSLGEKAGVEMILTLGVTPKWASARPDEPCGYGTGCAAEPSDTADWEDYVRTVAQRYRGRIKGYEIWNEPNLIPGRKYVKGYFSGSFDKMVELARAAYATVKKTDPQAIVLSPAVIGEPERLEAFLAAGGGNTFDVMAVHFYLHPPEQIVKAVPRFRDLEARYGLQAKPIWNTEVGFDISPSPNATGLDAVKGELLEHPLDHQTAAAWVSRLLILAAAQGLERTFWYAWDNYKMGLMDQTSGQPSAVGQAYGRTVAWLVGSKLSSCSSGGNSVWICELSRDGRRAWLAWRASGKERTATALPGPAAEAETLDGQTIGVRGRNVTVGEAPVLFKSDSLPWG